VQSLGASGVGISDRLGNAVCSFPRGRAFVHLALIPVSAPPAWPTVSFFGPDGIEIEIGGNLPGVALRCRIQGDAREFQQLRRRLNRALNHQRSGQVVAGMALLLALCGWIVGGDDGALAALLSAMPQASDSETVSPDMIRRQFGARLLYPADMPVLFEILSGVCRRAGLSRMPDLYYLPSPGNMNAYAVGTSDRSAIILADGLLRGMTRAEVAGILAHEIAHIRSDDGWIMTWAAAMCRAMTKLSLIGGFSAALHNGRKPMDTPPLAALLSAAPAVGQLLWLGLSRIRESDADVVALELVDDPQALIVALGKLERHHTGVYPEPQPAVQAELLRYLRSHPATWERVGVLMKLAAWADYAPIP
jgi:heat shock protein HtpX